MDTFLYAILLLILLLVGYELVRRFKIAAKILIFIPLFTFPLWPWVNHGSFLWIKLYTIIAGIIIITHLRYTPSPKYTFLPRLLYLLLPINIMVAVITDLFNSHYLNGIVGILLILVTPGIKTMEGSSKKNKDFLWYLPPGWIAGYTVWNFVFTLNTFPSSLLANIFVLATPLIIVVFRQKTWFQARFYTLGLYLVAYFCYPKMILYTAFKIKTMLFYDIANIVSFSFMLVYTIYYFYKKYKRKESKLTHQTT